MSNKVRYAIPPITNSYLNKGQRYKIVDTPEGEADIDPANGFYIFVSDVEGDDMAALCLYKGCFHLEGNDWTIVEEGEGVEEKEVEDQNSPIEPGYYWLHFKDHKYLYIWRRTKDKWIMLESPNYENHELGVEWKIISKIQIPQI